MTATAHSEFGTLTHVVLKHARDAFVSQAAIDAQWRALNFTAPPDFDKAVGEYDRFVEAVTAAGAQVTFLPRSNAVGLDSIYVRDASIVCDSGVILCSMGKALRQTEPQAQAETFHTLGESIIGAVAPPGRIEGGDVAWLDSQTLAVGRGYRTNDAGIEQLRELMRRPVTASAKASASAPELQRSRLTDVRQPIKGRPTDVELVVVPLPHWRGADDVFHLMSFISPVDRDLAVVYSPLMPVGFRELLLARGTTLMEVPDEEFETMGANVLAIAPRRCVMVRGNPATRRRLEQAGADVVEYDGSEISLKGGGGPTCLTRPLRRIF